MPSTRWRKLLGDLWGNKLRTILVVLSIAVGIFAVGMIGGTNIVLTRDLSQSYMATEPASATLHIDPFDDELIHSVRSMKELRAVEGRRTMTVRAKTTGDQWRILEIFVVDDYVDAKVNKVYPQAGAFPPPKRELLIERASLPTLQVNIGDTVLIEMPGGNQRELRVAGSVHDIGRPPSAFVGRGYGYVTFSTLEWLGQPPSFNQLQILVAENPLDKKHIQNVVAAVRSKVEKSGRTVYSTWVPDPGKHPADNTLQTFSYILGALGLLSLFLSGFLVVNTISAVLTQQVRQIGVMKAIGARNYQIMGLYFVMVLIFGCLGLLVGVPLGTLGAWAVGSYMAGLVNFDPTSFGFQPQVIALEVAVGLLVPLVASLVPVISGTRITAREAMNDYGLGRAAYGASIVDRLLERVNALSRPLLLSLRNTFRRKGRLALTLVTLILGGAIFIAVFSVRESALLTMDDAFKYFNYDLDARFRRTYRVELIQNEALNTPGVSRAEGLRFFGARRLRPNGLDGLTVSLVGVHAETDMIQPIILQGRWLLPGDENAVVINTEVLRDEPDLKVGEEITLKIDERETRWLIVGLARGVLTGPTAYANFPYFGEVIRDVGTAGSLWIQTTERDNASQAQIAKDLEENFKKAGIGLVSIRATSTNRASIAAQFDILVVFLLIMAGLLAVVGGLGLMGTMGLNVLERTREIGVMRAIGASDGSVFRVFLSEGIIVGLISWLASAILALPASQQLSDTVGVAFINAPLSYKFSILGVVLWLAIVVFLAALASFLPARNAVRISVREVLAYE